MGEYRTEHEGIGQWGVYLTTGMGTRIGCVVHLRHTNGSFLAMKNDRLLCFPALGQRRTMKAAARLVWKDFVQPDD